RGRRPFVPHGADRGALDPRQFAPGPRIRRRPRAVRPALLHQLGRAAVHSRRAVERRGVFTLFASVGEETLTGFPGLAPGVSGAPPAPSIALPALPSPT